VKTLIVVHNSFLKDQWIDRIKAFLPNARIGSLQGEDVEVEGKDIIIAMIQSLSMKDYPKETFTGIGLTIIDECHHIASEVFVRAFPKITSKHMLGLSATPERKDGLMHVISWFLGPILYRSETNDTVDPSVRVEVYPFDPDDIEFNKIIYNNAGVMFTSLMINKLAEFEPRTKFLCELLGDVMEEAAGTRQVLVLSDRVEHCKAIYEGLGDPWKDQACILSRDVKADQRAEWCATKKILIATYTMCKEGFDVPTLNTLLIATPRPDMDQVIGRILRVEKSKRTIHPLILDVVDSTFRRQFQERTALYKKRQYTIEMMKLV
jgi:superfamily II DNA or RNA helicase